MACRNRWQPRCLERFIATLRQDPPGHPTVLNKDHAQRPLEAFLEGYCHTGRSHMFLAGVMLIRSPR